MAFIYNLLDTWNNAGTVFSGIKLNVTNTASATGSKLIDLQIGGSTFFNVDKSGQVAFLAGTALLPSLTTSGDTNTGMWFPAADTIAWSTGGVERLRIASGGTVSTAGTLSVAAAGTLSANQISWASSTAFQPQIFLTNNAADATSAIWTTLKSRGGITPANSGDNIGVFAFNSYSTNGTSWSAVQISVQSEGASVTRHAGNIRFITTNTSDVFGERMRITSAGNVGIGTTAPDALLSVNGIASFGAGAVATPSITAFGDLNTGMWFPAADTIALSTGGSERLRIASSGNIGLGTSTFGTSAAKVFSIATGTAPTTGPADTIQIYSTDLSAGNTMLSLYTEGTIVNANTTAAATHRIAIRVNGTVYYLLANTAA